MIFKPKRKFSRGRYYIRKYRVLIGGIVVFVLFPMSLVVSFSVAPSNFPRGTIVRVNKDMSVTGTASLLKERGIIRSALVYKAYVKFVHKGKGVLAGSYLFDQPQSALRVAYRTAYGVSDLQKVKITVFEGTNTKEIGALIKKAIPAFDAVSFVAEAKPYEGYLFPETYFFNPDVQPEEVIALMREQFDLKIAALKDAIATSTKPFEDIMKMASIIEKEANDRTDRRMISGVLWNRINIDMPLQTDVPFYYILNRKANELTVKDLSTTSPYNTYLNKGLPPTPITNPGLDSIMAAMNPTKNPYLFYLADYNGVTHFAKTHDDHVLNKRKYLQ